MSKYSSRGRLVGGSSLREGLEIRTITGASRPGDLLPRAALEGVGLPGQVEDPLTDAVVLDLRRAALDGVGPGAQQLADEAFRLGIVRLPATISAAVRFAGVHGEDIALADASEAAFNERMPRPGRRPGRPRDTNSDETRWRILEAAIDAFAERGYDGVSTREIARHAEVTSATVYHHFPSKFALYQDAYQFAIEVAFGAYSRAVAGRESVLAELDAVLECSLGLMRERLAITSLAIHAQTDAV